MNAGSPARLPFLDSARGLAALSVVTWHCCTAIFNHPELTKFYSSPLRFFAYGEGNMIFFFIHSGFILSYAHSEFSQRISFASYSKYLASRIFRIYPLFLFVLMLSFLLKNTVFPLPGISHLSNHFLRFWNYPGGFSDLLRQAILAIRIPDDPYYRLIPQDWTLTIEVLVCPIIPLVNFLNTKFRIFSWAFILIFLKLFHLNTYLFEFAIGTNIYHYRNKISILWAQCSSLTKWYIFASGIILYTVVFGYPNIFQAGNFKFSPAIDRLMVTAGCSIFFIFILNSPKIQRVFCIPVITRIGKICYSLYVNHILLLILFSNIVISVLTKLTNNTVWITAFLFVSFFHLLNISLSLLTYKFIERPFNKWGKSISIFKKNDYVSKIN